MIKPSTKQPSTLAKRPRVRVQPATKPPWPKGHGCAFNLQPSTFNQTTFNLQPNHLQPSTKPPSTFNQTTFNQTTFNQTTFNQTTFNQTTKPPSGQVGNPKSK
ncbi:MAG: hypothetical protein F6K50_09610 [Moorea sp. SIO3I7]|uniref:hypothetical protein n=1 Tax=unclassified Moorena TaxID=2683338 RepID=UPI0013BF8CCA|nr:MULTISPECIES: hypothetical protein [unclassified Moorena]NEN95774.1 hypothetical protein [Moorena sp. SIO3I7]NEO05178.1 hypothetical protein [Moorena sp. SIO3I8]NEO21979.1 hypothetical protein [Moorena sp. SIO4A5]NEP21827.1 hypothetical protein [Moorena sp. SIO3I6]NEQ61333.1 hypothetical protein [Moorena sp. SIO4A1]